MTDTPTPAPLVPSHDLKRTPAQFFFEVGYGACWAEAYLRNDTAPFELTDVVVERAWEIAGEAHDDPEEFDRYLALANAECSNPEADVERLRAALEPFAQIAQRKAMLYLRPNDPIVMEAVRALAR